MRHFELDDMLIRPGTYFNPQTEILVVVDDSPEIDREIFEASEELDGAEWVLVSDESPLDETARDEALERFQATHQGSGKSLASEDEEEDEEEEDEELDGDLDADEEDLDRE